MNIIDKTTMKIVKHLFKSWTNTTPGEIQRPPGTLEVEVT